MVLSLLLYWYKSTNTDAGYAAAGVGLRMSELCFFREKNAKREIKIVGILSYIKDSIWKTMFGKPADSLERATDKQDECMIYIYIL